MIPLAIDPPLAGPTAFEAPAPPIDALAPLHVLLAFCAVRALDSLNAVRVPVARVLVGPKQLGKQRHHLCISSLMFFTIQFLLLLFTQF